MKKSISVLSLFLSVLFSINVIAQELPAPSPAATAKQRVGLTDLEIVYSRPGVKDRKIYGDLVPFDQMWRTGANKATAFSSTTDIEIMGNVLPAGTYAVFTIPGQEEWEVIFNSNTEQWGANGHKDEEDVLRVKVKPEAAEFRESMLFFFDNIRDESASINLHWEKTRISVPFSVAVHDVAIKNIDEAISEANGTFRVYNSSARYYLNKEMDAKKALEWAEKSVSMDKRYWNLTTLGRAQAANDMTKEAIKTAEEAKQLAVEAKSDNYIKQNEENIAAWKAKK